MTPDDAKKALAEEAAAAKLERQQAAALERFVTGRIANDSTVEGITCLHTYFTRLS